MPDFTVRGRNATAPGDAIISTLERDDAGLDRVINRARVSAQEVDTEVEFVGALTRSNLATTAARSSTDLQRPPTCRPPGRRPAT